MNFRTRLFVVVLLAVLVPMILLALFVRGEMTKRLTSQYERRVESLVSVIEEDLGQQSESIAASLAAIRGSVVDDNRFRRAAVDHAVEERRYLLDYAGEVMRLAGLSMLQIQDGSGRILSSGHFRNEYDRLDPKLPGLLSGAPGRAALVAARAPDEPFLALARVDSFDMGGKRFYIVAGVKVEERFLARLSREDQITVMLVHPGGVLMPGRTGDTSGGNPEDLRDSLPEEEIVGVLSVPFIDTSAGRVSTATFHVTHGLTEANELRRSIDRWFLVAVAVTCVAAVFLVTWLASRISRPLVELADKTSRIDLDRLDIDFSSRRKDEIGALSRLLGAMTGRLRASAVRIKDAERRATLGELARQINHDIKNGLTPIRNVFRHLAEVSRENPTGLPEVFKERQQTIDSSVSYLENLASNYARLSPRTVQDMRQSCDVNEIVHNVLADLGRTGSEAGYVQDLQEGALVRADTLSLRRILENLVDNAFDSLQGRPGTVKVSTRVVLSEGGGSLIRLSVSDTGTGMSEEQRARAFDDFYTTKENGTGLGLSIVRRLVMDLGGSVRVESKSGEGSEFVVELPGPADQ